MTRQEALSKLEQELIAKRESLRQTMADDLTGAQVHDEGVGDEGDAASDGTQSEINSQLAAFESRELHQIEEAIHQIRDGKYGICDGCGERIALTRLKALPFTTTCINCQRRDEVHGRGAGVEDSLRWANAFEATGKNQDREININDIELDL